jgi:hypothetical protein
LWRKVSQSEAALEKCFSISAVPDLYSRILPAIDCPESSILTINVSVIIIIIILQNGEIGSRFVEIDRWPMPDSSPAFCS